MFSFCDSGPMGWFSFSPSTYSTSLHGGFLFLSLIPPRCQSCRVTISDWSIRVSTARLQVLRLKVVVVFHSAKIIKSMPDDITTSRHLTTLTCGREPTVVGNHFWMPKLSLTILFWTLHGMRDTMYCFRVWSFPIERFTAHWFLCQHQLKKWHQQKILRSKTIPKSLWPSTCPPFHSFSNTSTSSEMSRPFLS